MNTFFSLLYDKPTVMCFMSQGLERIESKKCDVGRFVYIIKTHI
jgi:hypothetical protein